MSFSTIELNSILGYLENKTILVTGATGLLGMVFVEKILRVQPNVEKLYLLVRASTADSATHRMHNEIIGKELFKVLREKMGTEFDSFISRKLIAISGDVTSIGLGVKELKLREQMCNEIQIILHSAATLNFDERYDIALDVNTYGVLRVLSFAKKCLKLEMLVHVSTAYVCGERAGLILEDFSSMDELTKEITKTDLKIQEKNMVVGKLNELKAQGASEKVITNTMKDLGAARAKLYGWPNTYVFTKAMGEVYLEHSKGYLPVTVLRPAVVTSTYKEPFPGWIQNFRPRPTPSRDVQLPPIHGTNQRRRRTRVRSVPNQAAPPLPASSHKPEPILTASPHRRRVLGVASTQHRSSSTIRPRTQDGHPTPSTPTKP
ncbi:hypothetical protein M0R45_024469 [Rubus argutus]|uniref:Fatty acyl-CoA reductase n=1 Tax=Rubus argutus TaxID=59490 RepID=A0AAW1WRN2_RUBAR